MSSGIEYQFAVTYDCEGLASGSGGEYFDTVFVKLDDGVS